MAIFTVGSINADFFYYVDRLPAPGETLTAHEYARGLGGKGANQSIAAALAGSDVTHIGAVGEDGAWAIKTMASRGVDVSKVRSDEKSTGNATIIIDAQAENVITFFPGANAALGDAEMNGLKDATPGDVLLLQNEVNLSAEAASLAKNLGMKVLYSAAPFDVDAVKSVLPHVDTLLLNEVEYGQLIESLVEVPVPEILITRGAVGADLVSDSIQIHVDAIPVEAVDTTGAGDCFAGYFAAGLDQGLEAEAAMKLAARASALKVTRRGTSNAFPTRAEVDVFEP